MTSTPSAVDPSRMPNLGQCLCLLFTPFNWQHHDFQEVFRVMQGQLTCDANLMQYMKTIPDGDVDGGDFTDARAEGYTRYIQIDDPSSDTKFFTTMRDAVYMVAYASMLNEGFANPFVSLHMQTALPFLANFENESCRFNVVSARDMTTVVHLFFLKNCKVYLHPDLRHLFQDEDSFGNSHFQQYSLSVVRQEESVLPIGSVFISQPEEMVCSCSPCCLSWRLVLPATEEPSVYIRRFVSADTDTREWVPGGELYRIRLVNVGGSIDDKVTEERKEEGKEDEAEGQKEGIKERGW